jgi:LPS-assembly protein
LSAPRLCRSDPSRLQIRVLTPLVIAAWIAALATAASARDFDDEAGFEITAASIAYRERGELYVAEGDVLIVQGERRLSADWMAFSLATRRGAASGRVLLVEGEQRVEAEFMEFDVDSLQGVIHTGRIDTGEGGLIIEGEELTKVGEVDYEVHEGRATGCRCPEEDDRLPWAIEAEDAEVELGGYGRAKNSTVEVLGVPLIWLPWIAYPVKTERETGLLFPRFGYSGDDGVQFAVPFFWAARDELNVTVAPGYIQERGGSIDLAMEYVLGERSRGRFFGAFVLDKTANPQNSIYDQLVLGKPPKPNATNYQRERWAVAFDHDQYLPGQWRAKADVKVVSDNAFLSDFDRYGTFRTDLFLDSTVFAFRSFGKQGRIGAVGAIDYADDIQLAFAFEDHDQTILNRWPDLSLRALSTQPSLVRGLGLVTAMDSEYTYFRYDEAPWRAFPTAAPGAAGFFWDSGLVPGRLGAPTRGDGVYEEGEPMLERGHRFTLFPRLARPTRLGPHLDLYPEVGYAQTLYDGNVLGFDERGVFTARADLRTQLRGELQLGPLPEATHLVEPFVRYSWVRPRSQSDSSVYVPPSQTPQLRLRQLDPQNRVLDPSDRIERSNALAVGVQNRFRRVGRPGRAGAVLGEATLSFEHDFDGGIETLDAGGPNQLVFEARGFYAGWVNSEVALRLDTGAAEIGEGLAEINLSLPAFGWIGRPQLGTRYR